MLLLFPFASGMLAEEEEDEDEKLGFLIAAEGKLVEFDVEEEEEAAARANLRCCAGRALRAAA